MICARTIRTLAGPVKLTVEETPGGYSYSYSVKTAQGVALHHAVHLDRAIVNYGPGIEEYLRCIEEKALADLGQELTREIQ